MTTTGAPQRSSILRLSLPIVAIQLGTLLMPLVDTVIVGQIVEAPGNAGRSLSFVGLGHAWAWIWVVFGLGALMAIDPLISQAMGAGDRRAAGRAMRRGVLLAVVYSVPVSVPLFLAPEVLSTVLSDPVSAVGAAEYSRILVVGLPALYLYTALRMGLQSMKRIAPAFVAIAVANVINLVATRLLVLGYEPLHIPALGAPGAAWATVASQWTMVIMLLLSGWRSLKPYLLPVTAGTFSRAPILRMVRMGIPSGLQHQLEVGVFAATALSMERFGPPSAAGHMVALHLASVTFMIPLGISYGTSVLVGEAVGRGNQDEAKHQARYALFLGVAFMAICGALFLLLKSTLPRIWTTDQEVLAVASALLPVAAAFQVFDGFQVVAIGVLRGLGDLRTPAITGLVGFWLVGYPAGFVLAFPLGMGPKGLWWGLVLGLAMVALILHVRIRHHWTRPLRRLDVDQGEEGH